jgi:hypothetical protein
MKTREGRFFAGFEPVCALAKLWQRERIRSRETSIFFKVFLLK